MRTDRRFTTPTTIVYPTSESEQSRRAELSGQVEDALVAVAVRGIDPSTQYAQLRPHHPQQDDPTRRPRPQRGAPSARPLSSR